MSHISCVLLYQGRGVLVLIQLPVTHIDTPAAIRTAKPIGPFFFLLSTKQYLIDYVTNKVFIYYLFLYGKEMDDEAERTKLREVSKRLYAQLQEVEKKHQEEKERLQVRCTKL